MDTKVWSINIPSYLVFLLNYYTKKKKKREQDPGGNMY